MVSSLQVICLLSVIVTVLSSSPIKEEYRKSKLILEFDWPEPTKNLKRFPHPKSCVHFYHVKHDGSHVIKKCHRGEIFDYESLRCRDKALAKCWKDLIQKITSKKGRRHFSCPFPWGLYPDTKDCSQLYECLGGKPFLRKCPASTLFDKAERTCVSEKNAMCADKSDFIEHDDYRCPYKWGFFTHPQDCSKYYECLRKMPSIRTCKRNTLFDNFERRCLPMNRVKCGARMNPYEKILTTTEREISENLETENVKISTVRRKEPEKVITEIGVEKIVSTQDPKSEFETTITTEKQKTGFEKTLSPENPNNIFEKVVFTENQKTEFEKILSTLNQKIGLEKTVSTESSKEEKIASTEGPKIEKIVFTTRPKEEIQNIKSQIVSMGNSKNEKTLSTRSSNTENLSQQKDSSTEAQKAGKIVSTLNAKGEKIIHTINPKIENIVYTKTPNTGEIVSTENKVEKALSPENSKTDFNRNISDEELTTRFGEERLVTETLSSLHSKESSTRFEKMSTEIPKKESEGRIMTELPIKEPEERIMTELPIKEPERKILTDDSEASSQRRMSKENSETKIQLNSVSSRIIQIEHDQVQPENLSHELISITQD